MKRKLGLFLAMCLVVGTLTPAVNVQATELEQVEESDTVLEQVTIEEGGAGDPGNAPDEIPEMAEVEYTAADFPDPVLWGIVSNGAESVTAEDITAITSLDESYIFGKIKDLTGIEYLENLETVNFYRHAISDASPLLACSKLTSISLCENQQC